MIHLKSVIVFSVLCLCVTIIVLASLMSSTAQAEQLFSKSYSVEGRAVNLSLPKNYCAMEENHPSDKRLIDAVKLSVKGANEGFDAICRLPRIKRLAQWQTKVSQ